MLASNSHIISIDKLIYLLLGPIGPYIMPKLDIIIT